MSSQYNNNIAQAIDILLNKRLSELHYDQTIIAEICEIVDEEAGKYKIQYESVILNAESTDPSKRYKLNRSVYVKVPKSDFSQKLLIESAVDSGGSATAAALKELKNYRIPQTPVFEYPGTLNLIAGPEELEDGTTNPQSITLECFESYDSEKELQFRSMAETYEVFKIEAKFLIGLQGSHYQGNYGLKFEFLTTNSEQDISTKIYTLDTSNFAGNYFSYNPSGSRQYAFFQVPKGTLKALKSVTLFQDDIEQDDNPNNPIKNNGQVIGYKKTKNINISATDIKLTFYDITDLTDKNNYLHLQAPQGYYGENLEFSVQLLNQGENILKSDEHFVFWYEKKLENSEEEKSLAGEGWILRNEDSSSSFKIENITAALTYKVMIFNKNNIKLAEKEFTVQPYLDFVVPSIVETIGIENIELSMPTGYIADWVYGDNFIEKQESIILSANDFISQTVKVDCEIYQIDNYNFIGHNSIIVNAPVKIEDVQINFSGAEVYQYDANGSIFSEEANIEREMMVATIMNEERMNNIEKFELFLGEYQITENKDDWKQYEQKDNSLLDNVYYSQNEYGTYIIYYKVKAQYANNKTNNTFTCRITFKDFESVEKEKLIHFIKVGDVGTNDTTDNCILTPVPNNEIWRNTEDSDYLININVYNKGVKITDNIEGKYKITNIVFYNNEGEQNYSKNINYNQQIVVSKEDIIMDEINYIYLEIELNNKRIKSYYGIPVGDGYLVADRPTSYIRYSADGKNPQYKESSNNPSISSSFDFEKAGNKGYYFIKHEVQNVLYPIICYVNAYGNNAINYWDGGAIVDTENKTLLATQVVAGSRGNSSKDGPKFTGIVAGKIQDDTKKLNGLYGYKDNEAVFGFKTDSTGYLGTKKGQIKFDGNKGIITGLDSNKLRLEFDQGLIFGQNSNFNIANIENSIKTGRAQKKVCLLKNPNDFQANTFNDNRNYLIELQLVSDYDNNKHGPFIVLNSNNILLDDYYIIKNEETGPTEKLIIHNEFLGDLLAWSKSTIIELQKQVTSLQDEITRLENKINSYHKTT